MGQILSARRAIDIEECGEGIRPLSNELLRFFSPHPYATTGAPYGDASPFFLREDVASRVEAAAEQLAVIKPGYRFLIFDGYRPLEVQAFMRDYEFRRHAKEKGWLVENLSELEIKKLWGLVDLVWAPATRNEALPPPHATASAVDLTILDSEGNPLNMGSDFDEPSDRILPNYYRGQADAEALEINENRALLNGLLREQGLVRNSHEWWHFSRGDQLAALFETLENDQLSTAIYGFVR